MKTDFPSRPLPFPDPAMVSTPLAHGGGGPVIPRELRRTRYPDLTKEDVLQLIKSVKSPGRVVDDFAEQYRRYVGAGAALPLASGTASLHLALIGAGVRAGDEVIVPAHTFIASYQAVVAAKAIPVAVDIDPRTYCIDPNAVEAAIGPRTRAILPVHVHGLPADMGRLLEICDRRGLALVEDASHAHSATWQGRRAGSIGHAAGQSLMADKNFGVGGEGGIAFFRDAAAKAAAEAFLAASGIDYGMSWIAAAIGISQLERLPYYDAIRSRNAAFLGRALEETGLFEAPWVPEGLTHAYNMYRIRLVPERVGLDDVPVHQVKGAVQTLLAAEGVPAREWQNQPIPCHRPFQNRVGFGRGTPFRWSERADLGYARERFPQVLRMLDSTVVLCRELRSPIEYERIQAYALAFMKVAAHPEAIRRLAREHEYRHPYDGDARLG